MPISIYSILVALALSLGSQAGHAGQSPFEFEPKKQYRKSSASSHGDVPRGASCVRLGTCFPQFGKPDRIVCRTDSFCIPATPAWTRDRPTQSDHAFRGGFQMVPFDDPVEVPVPASMMTLVSAIMALIVCFRSRRKHR